MRYRPSHVFSPILILAAISNLTAGNVLSSRGIGTPDFQPNVRSIGMGGTSIAQTDPFSISRVNPASLATNNVSMISVQMLYENSTFQYGNDQSKASYGNFDGFSFVIPLGSRFCIASSLYPLTRIDYDLYFERTINNQNFIKSIRGDGGINAFNISLSYAIRGNLALGISGNYIFGNIEEEWHVDYLDQTFVSSQDVFSTHASGINFTAGILYRPFKFIQFGAIFSPQIDMNQETESYSVYSDSTSTNEGNLKIPGSWGAGLAVNLGKYGIAAADYETKNWTKFVINDQHFSYLKNTYRISLGYEYVITQNPLAHYYKRIAFRIGYSYQPFLLLDNNGENITEQWITAGIGFPFIMNASRMDIGFGMGRRGSIEKNNLSESIFRLTFSVTGGEKWFTRRY